MTGSSEKSIKPSISSPVFGEQVPASQPCQATLDLLLRRRSTLAKELREPGPDASQLETMLTAAARVPDHGKLAPWRFVIFQGKARNQFGNQLAKIWQAENPEASSEQIALEQGRFLRAPVVVGVIAKAIEHKKIPIWEQTLSAGAVCQSLLLAAHASGFAGQWLTEWYAVHPQTRTLLALEENEQIAGFIYIGSTDIMPQERKRPNLSERIKFWSAD